MHVTQIVMHGVYKKIHQQTLINGQIYVHKIKKEKFNNFSFFIDNILYFLLDNYFVYVIIFFKYRGEVYGK